MKTVPISVTWHDDEANRDYGVKVELPSHMVDGNPNVVREALEKMMSSICLRIKMEAVRHAMEREKA